VVANAQRPFACPLIEIVEGWLLRRSALKQLAEMQEHAVSGHRWDVTRGQWTT
jgi:uncharacterized protein YjiS (DUF1127 family)